MPKATFYTHVARPAAFACRLIARAYAIGGQILVWSVRVAVSGSQLDVDLWQQIPESFIPHEVWLPTDPMPSETPVLLAFGNSLPNISQDCTVLNLSADFWSQAPAIPNRILEIVGNSLEDLAEARDRFRAYRQSEFEIEHFSREGKD